MDLFPKGIGASVTSCLPPKVTYGRVSRKHALFPRCEAENKGGEEETQATT